MLQTVETTPTNPIMTEAAMAPRSMPPLLVSVPEARRQLGDIGKTCFYAIAKRHGIKLVKVGSLTRIPMAEVERVYTELMADDASPETENRAQALAAKSVASRRLRRGG